MVLILENSSSCLFWRSFTIIIILEEVVATVAAKELKWGASVEVPKINQDIDIQMANPEDLVYCYNCKIIHDRNQLFEKCPIFRNFYARVKMVQNVQNVQVD